MINFKAHMLIKPILVKLCGIFLFRNLYAILPLAMFFVFGIQALIGLWYLGGIESIQVNLIILVGILTYWVIYKISIKGLDKKLPCLSVLTFTARGIDIFIFCVSFVYFVIVGYALFTAEKIALIEAFRGSNLNQLVEAREMLFRTRLGYERVLPYLNAILSSAFMPYAIAIGFVWKRKYSPYLLALFILSLTPSLEKALIFKACFPIIFLAFNKFLSKKMLLIAFFLAASVLGATSILSNVGFESHVKNEVSNPSNLILIANNEFITREAHTKKYFPLRGESIAGQLMNRVLWIPYVTAYDWLKFFNQELNAVNLRGRTSLLISTLTGQSPYPMERQVFQYQFGLNATATGSANANFMIDAFINFGWIGVIVISGFVAIIVAIVMTARNPAACACLYFFLLQLIGGGFLGVFLGGGLLLFLCLVIFIRVPEARSTESSGRI